MSEQFPAGNYPSMPNEPGYGGDPSGAPPPSVDNAVKLMLVRAALSLVGLLLTVSNKGSLKDAIHKASPNLDPGQVDTAVNVAVTGSIVVGLVVTVLYVLLALQVRKGKSWARIVTLVFAGLSVLFGLVSLVSLRSAAPAISHVFQVVLLAVDIAIVVLLTRGPSTAYFRPRV